MLRAPRHQRAFRRAEHPEAQQVRVTAQLHADARVRCSRQVRGHDQRTTAIERERRGEHPAIADRDQAAVSWSLIPRSRSSASGGVTSRHRREIDPIRSPPAPPPASTVANASPAAGVPRGSKVAEPPCGGEWAAPLPQAGPARARVAAQRDSSPRGALGLQPGPVPGGSEPWWLASAENNRARASFSCVMRPVRRRRLRVGS
jgi:hypothetical protein